MSDEAWRPVDGWPYKVSDQGRVRRAEPGTGTYVGRVLTPSDRQGAGTGSVGPDGSRYQGVTLARDGEQRTWAVHQLVARAFFGPQPEGYEIDHINGDRTDNRADNLRYVARGHNRGSKLTDAEVQEVRERYETEDISQRELGEEYGVSRSHVADLIGGYRRSDV